MFHCASDPFGFTYRLAWPSSPPSPRTSAVARALYGCYTRRSFFFKTRLVRACVVFSTRRRTVSKTDQSSLTFRPLSYTARLNSSQQGQRHTKEEMADIDNGKLDLWIAQLKDCKQLTEAEVKKLTDMV